MKYLVITVFLSIALLEVPGLVKKRMFGEAVVYLALMLLALLYSLNKVENLGIPSADNLLEAIFGLFADIVFPERVSG